MFEWNSRRAKLQLAEKSDSYQSEALLELRKLQYESAISEERSASYAFNLSRGLDSQKVSETLTEIDKVLINKLEIPKRMSMREDLMAMKQAQRLAEANATLAKEKDSPTLDVFANVALNGMDFNQLPPAITQSFKTDNPTLIMGVKFSTPLDLGNVIDSKKGWTQEILAADLNFQRKQFEQDQEWKDLNLKFQEAKRTFELSKAIEHVQKEKMLHEKDRLQKGRSTTYQTLSFEQDYSSSQLSRIQAELQILQIIAKMKLFSIGEQQ
jgi:outer membrane protein TolC